MQNWIVSAQTIFDKLQVPRSPQGEWSGGSKCKSFVPNRFPFVLRSVFSKFKPNGDFKLSQDLNFIYCTLKISHDYVVSLFGLIVYRCQKSVQGFLLWVLGTPFRNRRGFETPENFRLCVVSSDHKYQGKVSEGTSFDHFTVGNVSTSDTGGTTRF